MSKGSGRSRRADILDVLGYVPDPEPKAGYNLLTILFRIGPVKTEAPISEHDLVVWEQRRGIELAPWQADLIVDMSRAYLSEMYSAKAMTALAPWHKARNMWKYVCDEKQKRSTPVKETPKDGSRQRRRNPAPG